MSKIADLVITDGHNDRYTHWPIRNMQFWSVITDTLNSRAHNSYNTLVQYLKQSG